MKYSASVYTPPAPPAIQSEFVAEFNPEDGEQDPLVEQVDPLPPKEVVGERKELDGEGDEGDDQDDQDEQDNRD